MIRRRWLPGTRLLLSVVLWYAVVTHAGATHPVAGPFDTLDACAVAAVDWSHAHPDDYAWCQRTE